MRPLASIALVVVLLCAGAATARADDATRETASETEPRQKTAPAALVVLAFEGAPPVTESTTRMIESLVLVELAEREGLSVLASADVASALEHEATRQLLGCSEGASCLAAIQSRLGARYVVTGDVSRVGPALRLDLVLIDVETSRPLAREHAEARSLQSLTRLLPALVDHVVAPLVDIAPRDIARPSLGRRMGDPDALRAAAIAGATTAGVIAVVTGVPLALATALMPFAGMAEFELVLFPAMFPLPVVASGAALVAALAASVGVDFFFGDWSIGRMLMSGAAAWLLALAFAVSSVIPVIVGVSVAYSVAWNAFPDVDPVTDPRFLTAQSLLTGSGVVLHMLLGALVTGVVTSGAYLGGIWLFPDDDLDGDDAALIDDIDRVDTWTE